MIPVNDPYGDQQLTLIEKDNQGVLKQRRVLTVRFVPLIKK
ncbi:MAG: hypothetical protein HRT52_21285 [Colwellia sp.]|nr:hypothetical protein [Colwellia sp.]